MPANPSTLEVTRASVRIALEDVTPTIALAFANDPCLIWSGEWQAYWRAGGNGYTKDAAEAGWYTIQAAYERTKHCDPMKQIMFERTDATPARGGDELREASFVGYRLQGPDGEDYFNDSATPLSDNDRRNGWIETPLYALASTDMAGAGEIPEACPVCHGDCGSANPPVIFCPMRDGQDHLTRAKARAERRAASGEVTIEGSIYEGMEACLVQHGRTIAHVMRYADAVDLATRLAAPQVEGLTSGEGWKLVPVEMTDEMASAVANELMRQSTYLGWEPTAIYRAMLAAAPKGQIA